jgi:hypothetical protein
MRPLVNSEIEEQVHPDQPIYNDILAQVMARYRFADRLLTGVERILEIGCEKGIGVNFLALPPYRRIWAFDQHEQSIAFAQKRYGHERLTFFPLAAPKFPETPRLFDAVICLEVFEHLDQAQGEKLLEGVCKRIDEKGCFLLSTPNRLLTSPNSDRPVNKFHEIEYAPNELENLLKKHFNRVTVYGQRLRYDRAQIIMPLLESFLTRLDEVEYRAESLWVRYTELISAFRREPFSFASKFLGKAFRQKPLFAEKAEQEHAARQRRNELFYKLLTPFLTGRPDDWEFEPGEFSRAVCLFAVCRR